MIKKAEGKKLFRMSRIAPKKSDEEIDSIASDVIEKETNAIRMESNGRILSVLKVRT